MMTGEFDPIASQTAPPRAMRVILIAVAVAFLAGIALMAYLISHSERAGKLVGVAPVAATPTPGATPALAIAATPQTPRIVADPQTVSALDTRVAELESRITRVGERAQLASGDAARAEGLLIAFAARRAVDRGMGLGYIEGQLRERFGASQPQAVATVVAAAREPLTVEDLQISLDDLAPSLASEAPGEGWWPAFRREITGLVVVRKAGSPSPEPSERLRRARRMLDAGRVDAALAEVARMPGRDKAQSWMTAARRYLATRQALDVLETSAIVEPKTTEPPPLLPEPVRPVAN